MKRFWISGLFAICCVVLCLGQIGGSSRRRPVKRVIQLTEAKTTGTMSFEEALSKRRSVRQFSTQELKPDQLSQLAWAGQGITDPDRGLRTAPSAGSTYPIDLYFMNSDGVFAYKAKDHTLEEVLGEDVRAIVSGGQGPVAQAPLSIIIAGTPARVAKQFRESARTYTYLEAGHVAQNIVLQAVCLELGSVTIGGLDKRVISQACKLGRGMEPIYIIPVGYASTEADAQDPLGPASAVTGKRAAIIVASQNYHDEELFGTMRVLESSGVLLTIVSSRVGVLRGMGGGVIESRVTLNQIRPDDFDVIVFVGGTGAAEFYNHPLALAMLRDAARKKKIIAGIGLGPSILGSAGLLRGVRATGTLEEQGRLQQMGAIYTGGAVERDGYIITGSGPQAVLPFGRAIVSVLAGQ